VGWGRRSSRRGPGARPERFPMVWRNAISASTMLFKSLKLVRTVEEHVYS
jgi:hypothetical protein